MKADRWMRSRWKSTVSLTGVISASCPCDRTIWGGVIKTRGILIAASGSLGSTVWRLYRTGGGVVELMIHMWPLQCQCKHCWRKGRFSELCRKFKLFQYIVEECEVSSNKSGESWISNGRWLPGFKDEWNNNRRLKLGFWCLMLMRLWNFGDLGERPCSCGLLNFFPTDELGKVTLWAWELCSVPRGFTVCGQKNKGREKEWGFLFFFYCCSRPTDDSHRWLCVFPQEP